MKKHIIAMGGGGFSMEPENPLLDQFVLSQSSAPLPRICFVPTASGDSEAYIANFYAAMGKLPCEPSHLPFFSRTPANLRAFVMEKDILYVGGGNTKSLLAVWAGWGLDAILREAHDTGKILCGVSAGSLCWFQQGVTDSVADRLSAIACLGILSGSNCPHYDGEAERRPAYRRLVANGEVAPGLAADDGAALHFIDGRLHEAVSSRPGARAYRVSTEGEAPLPTRYLG